MGSCFDVCGRPLRHLRAVPRITPRFILLQASRKLNLYTVCLHNYEILNLIFYYLNDKETDNIRN